VVELLTVAIAVSATDRRLFLNVSCWWSFYVKAWSRRRLMTGPIREMEALLGHRLQVTRVERQEKLPGVYLVEAWSILEVESLEQSAVAVLRQLQKVSSPVFQSSQLDADPTSNGEQVISYYWGPPEQIGLPKFTSSGVLLSYNNWRGRPEDLAPSDENNIDALSRRARDAHLYHDKRTMPIMQPVDGRSGTEDFLILLDVWIRASTKPKLVALHWPAFKERLPEGVELLEITTRSYDKGPFKLKLQRVLHQVTDDQAIACCLMMAGALRLEFEYDDLGKLKRLSASKVPGGSDHTGIVAYSLVPITQTTKVATNSPPAAVSAAGGT
jgi:hypothetical protein